MVSGFSRCTRGAAGGAAAAPGTWGSRAAGTRAGGHRSRGARGADPPPCPLRPLHHCNHTHTHCIHAVGLTYNNYIQTKYVVIIFTYV